MIYNMICTYSDDKDGKLIIRMKIPENTFQMIEELNGYLTSFGRYRVDEFWLSKSKVLAYDVKTTLLYKKFNEKPQNEQ